MGKPLLCADWHLLRSGCVLSVVSAAALLGCDRGAAEANNFSNQPSEVQQAPTPTQRAGLALSPANIAFPGAQGFGAVSVGGRGGKIVQVTTLADSGPGSFRSCVMMEGPRVCVFRVSGVIRFTTAPPIIRSPFLTIAGETAPGDGIILAHSGGTLGTTPLLLKKTHDIIIRHIRVRNDRLGANPPLADAFTIEASQNVIIDHVSGSWAQDENINGHRQTENLTISWSIFAEGIPRHDKCALLASDPTGPQNVSFIGNLCAHNGDRNPDVNFWPGSCVELVNNVFYNAQSQFTEIWETYGGSPVNVVANVYRAGPDTNTAATGIDREEIGSTGKARIFASGNTFEGNFVHVEPNVPPVMVSQPVCPLTITPMSASAAFAAVTSTAGAFPRDTFDQRIVSEVNSRTGRIVNAPGTMPALRGGTPYADTDKDGMSDSWERANGTNPSVADPWGDKDGDGYPNLTEFLDYAHQARLTGRAVS